MTPITRIRFWCVTHQCVLKNCGSGRVFAPTYTIEGDEFEDRKDKEGFLELDTSELYCPVAGEYCDQNWEIQGE
jgi:hypothetical protein